MKASYFLLIALVASALSTNVYAQAKPASMQIDTIKVHDMRCGQCETRIHRALKKIAGIVADSTYADAQAGYVVAFYDPSVVTRHAIESAIVKTGYGVGSTPGDAAARKALPGCCK